MGKTCQSSTQCFSEVSHNYVTYFVQYFWCSSTGILLWLANFSSPLTIIKVWNTSLGAPGALTNHLQHHPRHQLLNQQARHCQISSGQMHFWGNRLTVIFFMFFFLFFIFLFYFTSNFSFLTPAQTANRIISICVHNDKLPVIFVSRTLTVIEVGCMHNF